MAAPLLPKSVKRAVVDALTHDMPSDDVAFRPASPASPPEIARSIFDLHEAGLLEGRCYYEFGLFRGFAFWFAHQMIRKMEVRDFHCHGFDSFEGFPDVDGPGDEGAPWAPGTMACSREQVEAYLREFDADMSRISLHEGWFSDELFAGFEKENAFGEASLVMLDCDFYESTVPVLRFIPTARSREGESPRRTSPPARRRSDPSSPRASRRPSRPSRPRPCTTENRREPGGR